MEKTSRRGAFSVLFRCRIALSISSALGLTAALAEETAPYLAVKKSCAAPNRADKLDEPRQVMNGEGKLI